MITVHDFEKTSFLEIFDKLTPQERATCPIAVAIEWGCNYDPDDYAPSYDCVADGYNLIGSAPYRSFELDELIMSYVAEIRRDADDPDTWTVLRIAPEVFSAAENSLVMLDCETADTIFTDDDGWILPSHYWSGPSAEWLSARAEEYADVLPPYPWGGTMTS